MDEVDRGSQHPSDAQPSAQLHAPDDPAAHAPLPNRQATEPNGAPSEAEIQRRAASRRRRVTMLALILLIAAVAVIIWLIMNRGLESTDDAFIDGDAVSIAPQVGGKVRAVHFTDNQVVGRGDLLLEIDPREYEIAVATAKAKLESADAQIKTGEANLAIIKTTAGASVDQARSDLARQQHLVQQSQDQVNSARATAQRAAADASRAVSLYRDRVMSKQDLDKAQAAARSSQADLQAAQRAVSAAQSATQSAKAQLDQALTVPQQIALREAALAQAHAAADQAAAELRQAQLNLSYTRVLAPQSGRIAARSVNPGDTVQANQMLARLVIGMPWITANFKETQITHMAPGQPARIKVDAFPDMTLHGYVDSIQPATGTQFSLLPAENATGNYVKVVQRVPVKIVLDNPATLEQSLPLGLSVEPEVDTTAPAAAVQPRIEPPATLEGDGKVPDGGTAQ
ncbi:MAG TPA: HlyD family secretion protein [Stellaceae bacterium]|jgi:membrane fusion protein (multidrug efflux system)|nr:HlyD family secretion protein [Stellaceae bacterium]